MGEFEAYNKELKIWECFPPSKYSEIKSNPKYSKIIIDENNL